MLRSLAVCLLALQGWFAFGQLGDGGRLPFALLGPDQGLPSTAVICLTQDTDGFIWMGTENGLIRYEGGHIRRWTGEDGMPSAYVSSLLPAQGGGVWVLTNGGLLRFQGGRFERAEFGQGVEGGVSNLITLDRQGRIWALNGRGLFVQEAGLQFKAGPQVAHPGASFLASGRKSGAVYVAGPGWLQAFMPDGHALRWGQANGLPPEHPSIVAEDGSGRLWVGYGRTLVAKEPGTAHFVDRSKLLAGSLSPNCLPFTDPDGSLWLPTQAGALRLEGQRSELLNMEGGLPFRWVRSLFRDREGTLWVWGPGLARLQGSGRIRNYSLSKSGSGEIVWFMIRDRSGRLLVGTDDGAATLGPQGLERIPGTEGHRIKGLLMDRTGTLWMVGTTGPALWLRAGASRAEPAALGELGSFCHFVSEDSQGRIWLGHAQRGVLRWDPSSRRLIQEVAPAFAQVPRMQVFGFREDGTGRLWFGTSEGLLVSDRGNRWKLFAIKDGLQRKAVNGLAFLPDGSAWIHYQEPCGLTRVRMEGGRLLVLEHRTRGPGLRSNLVYAVETDGQGRTWVTTDQGVDRLDPPLHFGRRDGMPSEDCDIHALRVEEGCLWIGTVAGLVRLDTAGLEQRYAPPQAYVLQAAYGRQTLEPPFGSLDPLPAQDGTATFRVTAPSYRNEGELRFQVRLQGLEEAWQTLEDRTAHYAALPGGRYRFEVRASYGEGDFGPIAAFPFRVRPPWWKTWWAYATASLFSLAAILGVIRLRVASLARSKVMLESLVGQRTEELKARNEDLSAALGKVKLLSGLIPICASCKKIRDDRGYWNQLENYISEHSEALFSHGICPECSKELYPELARMQQESLKGTEDKAAEDGDGGSPPTPPRTL